MKVKLLGFVMVLASGCGDGCGGDGGIGPEGGTVVSDDGLLTLTIPSGSFSGPTVVRITREELAELESFWSERLGVEPEALESAYRIEPQGIELGIAATYSLELPQQPIKSPGSLTVGSRMVWQMSGDDVEPVAEQRFSLDGAAGMAFMSGELHRLDGVAFGREHGVHDIAGLRAAIEYPESMCVGEAGSIEVRLSALSQWLGNPFVNTEPPIWEAVDARNDAQLDGGMFATTIADGADGAATVTIAVTCPPEPGDFPLLFRFDAHFEHDGVPPDCYDAHVEVAGVTVMCEPCGTSVAEGAHPTVIGVEALVRMDPRDFQIYTPGFSLRWEDDIYVAVAGDNGQAVHRLSDGMIVHDFRAPSTPTYAAIGVSNSLVSIGPDGYSDRRWNEATGQFGFAQLGLFGQNLTDLAPIRAVSGGVHGVLVANNSIDQVERLDPDPPPSGGFTVRSAPVLTQAQLAAVAGAVVSVYSPAGEGPFLGVSDDGANPGELFWVDPADPGGLIVVGQVGAGPRRIRCLEPAGTPCAVSSYVAGAITLIDWPSRAAAPTIGGTTVAVAGPVGIDLALVGGAPTVASTGFADGTLHLTTIGASLTPTDQTTALPTCTNPGHVIFTPGETHVVVTCNGSDTYEAIPVP